MIKDLAEELKNQFFYLEENTEKYLTFMLCFQAEKSQELIKLESKSWKIYPTYYNLLMMQNLWQDINKLCE